MLFWAEAGANHLLVNCRPSDGCLSTLWWLDVNHALVDCRPARGKIGKMLLYPRNLKPNIIAAAGDTPVILVNGARQTGKSTIMQSLFSVDAPAYVTLDEMTVLGAARAHPQSFIESLPEKVILDEIQRAPELMLPIKLSVDRNRKPGRFFLTGSADVMSLPKVSDSLAGRIEIHTLWPLSQGEIRGSREGFIDALFSDSKLSQIKAMPLNEIIALATIGGYPDVQNRAEERRYGWFDSYISSLMERDVRDLSHVEKLTALPNLLALLASRAGSLLNNSDLSRSLEIPLSTLKRYLSLLELLFLVVPVRPWFSNVGKRLIKVPKIYLNDTGLVCHLLNADKKAIAANGSLLGAVIENFVVMELIKQLSWSDTRAKLFHFRTLNGQEVDFVLEAADGRIVGIECKAGSAVRQESLKGLLALKELAGKKFHRGIVLYSGTHVIGVAEDMQAVPIPALWETVVAG
jgi:predicted AAA+ superfamily ATPase